VRRRVAITGLGAVTPIGIGVKAFWEGLREGALGVGPITRFDPAPFACQVAAEVKGFEPAGERLTPGGRFAQFGMAAARMAYDDTALPGLRAARGFAVCIYAEVLGYGSGSDGLDLRTVDPSGASASHQGRPQRGHSSTPSPTLRAAERGAAAPPRAD
jgi:3-oxoacyl-(acyl-carrier-protein) synthase